MNSVGRGHDHPILLPYSSGSSNWTEGGYEIQEVPTDTPVTHTASEPGDHTLCYHPKVTLDTGCWSRWNTDRHSSTPMWLEGRTTKAQALIFGVVEKKNGRYGDSLVGKCWGVHEDLSSDPQPRAGQWCAFVTFQRGGCVCGNFLDLTGQPASPNQ